MHAQALPKPAPRVLSRQPSKLSDCHQSKQIHALKALTWGLALRQDSNLQPTEKK
jgi:hypothetical protein